MPGAYLEISEATTFNESRRNCCDLACSFASDIVSLASWDFQLRETYPLLILNLH